jgi:hypothetical protein
MASYARCAGCANSIVSRPRLFAEGSTSPGFRVVAAVPRSELVLEGLPSFVLRPELSPRRGDFGSVTPTWRKQSCLSQCDRWRVPIARHWYGRGRSCGAAFTLRHKASFRVERTISEVTWRSSHERDRRR